MSKHNRRLLELLEMDVRTFRQHGNSFREHYRKTGELKSLNKTLLNAITKNPSEKSEGFFNGRKYSADKTGKQLDSLPSIPREKLSPAEKVLADVWHNAPLKVIV